MQVPGWLLPHRVTVEPYTGDSAYGPTYGPPVGGVPAMVAEVRKQVRAAEGKQVLATAQIIAAPNLVCPPGSRVTLPSGRVTRALTTAAHTAPGLPVPECVEVMCE